MAMQRVWDWAQACHGGLARMPVLRSVGFGRAVLEGTLLWLLLLLALRPDALRPEVFLQGYDLLAWPLTALYVALRWRRPSFLRWPNLVREAAQLTLWLLLALTWRLAMAVWFQAVDPYQTVPFALTDHDGELMVKSGLMVVLAAGARLAWLLLPAWQGLCQRRLFWALTHRYLLCSAVLAMLPFVFFAWSNTANPHLHQFYDSATSSGYVLFLNRLVLGFLSVFAGGSLAVFVVLAVLALPLAGMSAWAARGVTQRLRPMTQIAAALGAGQFHQRLAVEGSDEIARLQQQLNDMGADLDRYVAALRVERDKVAAMLASRRRLFAGLSHDLRTPLAVACGHVERAVQCDDPQTALPAVQRQLQQMQGMVDDLFALARDEEGQLRLASVCMDVRSLLTAFVADWQPLLWARQRVSLTAQLPPGSLMACVEPKALRRLLANVVDNAARHTPPGGIVMLSVMGDSENLILAIQDTGEGMAAEQLTRVWEPYVSHTAGGTGLGLGLVPVLAGAMGGAWDIESQPGLGTTVTLRFGRQRAA